MIKTDSTLKQIVLFPPQKNRMTSGIFLMILASFFFSIMGALVKSVSARLPSMESVFFRGFISLLFITPWMIKKRIPLLGNRSLLLFIRSASGFTALALSFYVLNQITLADATVLNQTNTLFVALLSVIILKEKVSTPLIIYIICAFIGAILVVKPDGNLSAVPGLLGLASGFFAAVAYISIKALHETESFFTMVFGFSLFSTAAALLMGYSSFIVPTPLEAITLVGIGLCGTIGQLTLTYSYKFSDASIVSPYSLTGVFFSALLGILFWGEFPDRWAIGGGILIIACCMGIINLDQGKKEEVLPPLSD